VFSLHSRVEDRGDLMPVAAIYDIHGNLPALEAVLEDIRQAAVDLVVVGGDVVPGPMAAETLDCLEHLQIPAVFISGNGEREVLALRAGAAAVSVPDAYLPVMRWVAQQLRPEHVQWIARWPQTVTMDVAGIGEVLFCHATPRSDTELFTRLTPDEQLLPWLEAITAPTVVCGHTHMPFERRIGGRRVLNAGSVGMPFGAPGAYWLLLGPGVQFRHTTYDLETAAARINDTDYPQAKEFASTNVLSPPTEARMLGVFTRGG
jgi:predicted phosphodiesterase